MSRKLASVKVVNELLPIEGADKIELARVGGWKCIVKKDEFKANDMCVFFEIDSMLPLDNPAFAFLEGKNVKIKQVAVDESATMEAKRFSRLKSMKMKGQLSQGLALPLSAFPSAMQAFHSSRIYVEDEVFDVTNLIGVVQYDPEEERSVGGTNAPRARTFPQFIPKTDQERVQNISIQRETVGQTFEVTIKLDGSSMTVWIEDDGVGVASRNQTVMAPTKLPEEPTSNFMAVALRDKLDIKLEAFKAVTGRSIALQGELMGPGIQNNQERFVDHQFFVFDIYDIDKREYLLPLDRQALCEHLKIQHVPVHTVSRGVDMMSCEQFLEMAEGPSINAVQREGLVFKSHGRNRYNEIVSFKAISNKWLLKQD